MVMPSWAPESWNDSSRSALRTVRAVASPRVGLLSISARSTVTRENSAADEERVAGREQHERNSNAAGLSTNSV